MYTNQIYKHTSVGFQQDFELVDSFKICAEGLILIQRINLTVITTVIIIYYLFFFTHTSRIVLSYVF